VSARRLAVIAGSGMGPLAGVIETRTVTPFADIEGVGACGVDGHAGEVREGTVAGRECLLVLGRRHGYEGAFEAVGRLVAHLAGLGATDLLVTSAAGALSTTLHPGDLMVFRDLVDRQNRRPAGPVAGFPAAPPRLDAGLTAAVERAARTCGVALHRGTGVCGLGPAYETVAEVTSLQFAAGDVATMSGAPEIAAAAACGLRVAAVALVTNPCTGVALAAPSHAEVLRVGRETSAGLARLVRQLIMEL
jgi:inosine/guanosine/xanthosine phosphorylase family protein